MTRSCSSDACAQGKRPCPTPTACGAEVIGGTYFPKLAEARPVFALRNDHDDWDEEPMSALVTACFIAFIVTVMLALLAAAVYGMVFP